MSLDERIQALVNAYDLAAAEVRRQRDLLLAHHRAWKNGLLLDEYMAGIASTEGELAAQMIVWTFRDVAAAVKQAELNDELEGDKE